MRFRFHHDSSVIRALPSRRFPALLTLSGLALVFTVANCAPARGANCTNDGDCPDADIGRAYCVHSRCVECVTNSACGDRQRCAAGTCVPRGS